MRCYEKISDGPYIEENTAEVRLGTMTENFDKEADGLETLSEPGQYID